MDDKDLDNSSETNTETETDSTDTPEVEEEEEREGEDSEESTEVDDEVEDEEEGPDEVEDAAPAKASGRAGKRIQALKKERDEARERERSLQAQLATAQERQRHEARASNTEAEQARVNAMDPLERIEYLSNKKLEGVTQQLSALHFQLNDTKDLSTYQAKASSDPLYEKYSSQVEEALASMRAKGTTAPREAILDFLVGRDMRLKGKVSAGSKAKAAQRVAAAKGKPVSGRGDANSSTRRGKTAEERLNGVLI